MKEKREKLKNVRKNLGLTIEEISQKMGITVSYYQKIENNSRNPSFENIKKLIEILNCKYEDIF